MHVNSMREAVFIVSPNMLNLGSLVPMRPLKGTTSGVSYTMGSVGKNLSTDQRIYGSGLLIPRCCSCCPADISAIVHAF